MKKIYKFDIDIIVRTVDASNNKNTNMYLYSRLKSALEDVKMSYSLNQDLTITEFQVVDQTEVQKHYQQVGDNYIYSNTEMCLIGYFVLDGAYSFGYEERLALCEFLHNNVNILVKEII